MISSKNISSYIPTIILTSENSEIVLRRAEKLQIDNVYINEKQKLNRMTDICKQLDISLDEVAYIGDDLNDLVVRPYVGCLVSTADACNALKKQSDIRLINNGGKGAVRELCEYLIGIKKPSFLLNLPVDP